MSDYRPRCKGTCGDYECEQAEQEWRRAHTLGADDNPIMSDAQDGPYPAQEKAPIVVIESPYGGENVERNILYLRAAIRDSLDRGEAPFASHAIYTTGVDDLKSKDRPNDIQRGFRFRDVAAYTVVYEDLGISHGMQLGIEDSKRKLVPVKYRTIKGWGKEESSN
jgi:hypothetical protein